MPCVATRRKARGMQDMGTGMRFFSLQACFAPHLTASACVRIYKIYIMDYGITRAVPVQSHLIYLRGTGRFQLFEDAKKRGYGGKSEGAKLRRQNAGGATAAGRCREAIRFFEKVNGKFTEWGRAACRGMRRADAAGLELRRLRKEAAIRILELFWLA